MATLDQLPVGVKARIVAIIGDDEAGLRLQEMGLIPGEPIVVIRRAPLGDPIEISVLNYNLCLRRSDADAVSVEIEGP